MFIEIVKAINNEKFVSKKHEDYHKLSRLTKRIWLNEEIDVICDGSAIYSLRCKNGFNVEGSILEKGYDKTGFYIIFNMNWVNLDNDILDLRYFRVPKGKAELLEVFNPKDEVFKELINEGYNGPYMFSNSILSYRRTEAELELKLKLGALGDSAIDVVLSEIQEEAYQCEEINGLDAFIEGRINEIYFRKYTEGEYVIKFDNSYKEFIYPEGYNCLSEPVEPKIIKHTNQGIIKCKKVVVKKYNYFIDNLKSHGIDCFLLNKDSGENMAKALRKRWSEAFLMEVTTEDIYIEQYLWHVFSYERIIALTGEQAKEQLDNEKSSTRYMFFNASNAYGEDICYRLENAANFSHDMLACYSDVYLTDEDFLWTYVKTHEDGYCGPYFYKK